MGLRQPRATSEFVQILSLCNFPACATPEAISEITSQLISKAWLIVYYTESGILKLHHGLLQ